MWFYFAFLSALANSVQLVARRTHGSLARPVDLSWWSHLLGVPAVLALLYFSPHPYWTSLGFLLPGLAAAALNNFAAILSFSAYKYGEASTVAPLTNLLPIFLIATSFMMFGTLPSHLAVLAILLIVFGIYYSSLTLKHSFLQPFRSIWKQRGSRAMLGVVLIWSVSVNLEKIALHSTTPAFLLFYGDIIGIIMLAMYLAIQKKPKRSEKVLRRWWKHLLVIAIFSIMSIYLQMKAVTLTTNTSYVLAVKRFDVLLTILFAGLFLREDHIRKRLTGAAIALVGVALLYFVK